MTDAAIAMRAYVIIWPTFLSSPRAWAKAHGHHYQQQGGETECK